MSRPGAGPGWRQSEVLFTRQNTPVCGRLDCALLWPPLRRRSVPRGKGAPWTAFSLFETHPLLFASRSPFLVNFRYFRSACFIMNMTFNHITSLPTTEAAMQAHPEDAPVFTHVTRLNPFPNKAGRAGTGYGC